MITTEFDVLCNSVVSPFRTQLLRYITQEIEKQVKQKCIDSFHFQNYPGMFVVMKIF